jgi:hypothetical protein
VRLTVTGQAKINDFSAEGTVPSLARIKLEKEPCLSAVNEKALKTKKNSIIKNNSFLSII